MRARARGSRLPGAPGPRGPTCESLVVQAVTRTRCAQAWCAGWGGRGAGAPGTRARLRVTLASAKFTGSRRLDTHQKRTNTFKQAFRTSYDDGGSQIGGADRRAAEREKSQAAAHGLPREQQQLWCSERCARACTAAVARAGAPGAAGRAAIWARFALRVSATATAAAAQLAAQRPPIRSPTRVTEPPTLHPPSPGKPGGGARHDARRGGGAALRGEEARAAHPDHGRRLHRDQLHRQVGGLDSARSCGRRRSPRSVHAHRTTLARHLPAPSRAMAPPRPGPTWPLHQWSCRRRSA